MLGLKKFIRNTVVASGSSTITSTQPSPVNISDNWLVGNLTYESLCLNFYGALDLVATAAGAIVERGALRFLRELNFSTDKHGRIIDRLDGITLHNLQTVRGGRRPVAVDIDDSVTGTPSFEVALKFDFFDRRAARPEDTVLDMLISRPELSLQYGIPQSTANGDMIVGGTYTTVECDSLTQEVHVKANPGPVDGPKEGPVSVPYWGILKYPINSTVTQQQIGLSYGDRGIKRLYITQRNGTTLAELANTVIGANRTDRLSLNLNGFRFIDSIQWTALQNENAGDYNLDSMPPGMAVLDFAPDRTGGYRLSNILNALTNIQGTLELLADVTSVTNGQLWIIYEAVKPIPSGALRPAAAAGA